jgi:hypothetical protein
MGRIEPVPWLSHTQHILQYAAVGRNSRHAVRLFILCRERQGKPSEPPAAALPTSIARTPSSSGGRQTGRPPCLIGEPSRVKGKQNVLRSRNTRSLHSVPEGKENLKTSLVLINLRTRAGLSWGPTLHVTTSKGQLYWKGGEQQWSISCFGLTTSQVLTPVQLPHLNVSPAKRGSHHVNILAAKSTSLAGFQQLLVF